MLILVASGHRNSDPEVDRPAFSVDLALGWFFCVAEHCEVNGRPERRARLHQRSPDLQLVAFPLQDRLQQQALACRPAVEVDVAVIGRQQPDVVVTRQKAGGDLRLGLTRWLQQLDIVDPRGVEQPSELPNHAVGEARHAKLPSVK